jgi:hypothetical protein
MTFEAIRNELRAVFSSELMPVAFHRRGKLSCGVLLAYKDASSDATSIRPVPIWLRSLAQTQIVYDYGYQHGKCSIGSGPAEEAGDVRIAGR